MTDEEAKAVQEIGKATQEVAKVTPRVFDSIDACGSFLRQLVGDPALEASGMFHDWLKYRAVQFCRYEAGAIAIRV